MVQYNILINLLFFSFSIILYHVTFVAKNCINFYGLEIFKKINHYIGESGGKISKYEEKNEIFILRGLMKFTLGCLKFQI